MLVESRLSGFGWLQRDNGQSVSGQTGRKPPVRFGAAITEKQTFVGTKIALDGVVGQLTSRFYQIASLHPPGEPRGPVR